MNPFSISCTTCQTKLKVRDESAIGKLLDCPKCGSFVLVEAPSGWQRQQEGNFNTTVVAEKSESSGIHVVPPPAVLPPPVSHDPGTFVSGPPSYSDPLEDISVSQIVSGSMEGVEALPGSAEPQELASVASADAPALDAPPSDAPPGNVPQNAPLANAGQEAQAAFSLPQPLLILGAAGGGVVLACALFVLSIWAFSGKQEGDLAHNARPESPQAEDSSGRTTDPSSGSNAAPSLPSQPAVAGNVPLEAPTPAEADPTKTPPGDSPTLPPKTGGAPKPADPKEEVSIEPAPAEAVDPKAVSSALERFAPFLEEAFVPAGETPGESPPVKPAPEVEPDPAESRAEEPARPRPEPRKIEVAARLADRIPQLEFTSVPLAEFVQFVSDFSALPITLDPETLMFAGVTPERTLSVSVKDASVGTLLKEALAPLGLAYETSETGLVIGRPNPADGKLRAANYAVADLVAGDSERLETLAAQIAALIAPESWSAAGGTGTISASPDKGSLAVTQTEPVHFEVLLFCEKLRVARGLAPKSRFDKALFRLEPRTARADAKLAVPISLNYSQPAPLVRILDRLGKTAGLRILVDWQAAGAAGWPPEAEGTVVASKLSLSETLTALLKPMDLTYRVVDDGLLQVTSLGVWETRLEFEIYPVADLLPGESGEQLIERIKAALGEELFPEGAAGGEIRFDVPGKCLLVSLPQPRHAELAALLAAWREAR